MFKIDKIKFDDKKLFYNYLNLNLSSILCNEKDSLANLCNTSAILWMLLDDINWAGFYLFKNDKLILGPFQGKPACTNIEIGKGVCGTAAKELRTVIVENVHSFPGHIACDSETNSEVVVPIIKNDKLVAVLDIDSPILNRFDNEDGKYLEGFVEVLNNYMNWDEII